jgi:hypothetical protein
VRRLAIFLSGGKSFTKTTVIRVSPGKTGQFFGSLAV